MLTLFGSLYLSTYLSLSVLHRRLENLKKLDQEQLRIICKRHESNNLLIFIGPSNSRGLFPWPQSSSSSNRRFWEFQVTQPLSLMVGNMTYLRDPNSPNSMVAQGRPMVFTGGYTNLFLMKYMFADVWEVQNLTKWSGINKRPHWFEPKYLNSSTWNREMEWAPSFGTFEYGAGGLAQKTLAHSWNGGMLSKGQLSYEWYIPCGNRFGSIYKDDPDGYFPDSPDFLVLQSGQHWPIPKSILPAEAYILYGDKECAHVVFFQQQHVLYLSWNFLKLRASLAPWFEVLDEFRNKHARRARCCHKGQYKKMEGASVARKQQGDTTALESRRQIDGTSSERFSSWSGAGAWSTFNTCPLCPRGSICPDGDEVQVCPRGSVNLAEGQTDPSSCKPCAPGTIASGGPSLECSKCERGSVAPFKMSLQCFQCQKGSYAKFNGSDRCRLCAFGTWHPNIGSYREEDCALSGGYVAAAVLGSIFCFAVILFLASVAFPRYYERIKERMLALERRRGEDIVGRARAASASGTADIQLVGDVGEKMVGSIHTCNKLGRFACFLFVLGRRYR